jgi:membrane protease YdiL (CAAX protease family)
MGWLAFAAASALGGPMPLQLAGVTCALCACFAAGKPPWTTLGLHRWNWRGVGMVPATYMALLLPLNGLLWVSYLLCSAFDIPFESQPIVEQFAQMKSFRDIATFVFMATVIAPVCEELFFRGFLHGWFCAWMPRPVSWVVTSALFAAAHWHFPTFLPLFLLGGVLVLLYEITGSLWTSVLLHTLFNSITLVVALRFAPPTH